MLTLKQCKEILSDEAKGLTDNEILEMRDWLSVFAELIIESTDFSDLPVKKIRKTVDIVLKTNGGRGILSEIATELEKAN